MNTARNLTLVQPEAVKAAVEGLLSSSRARRDAEKEE